MKIPRGMEIGGKNKNDYVLKLHRNIYGQKQAGRVWYQYLSKKLVEEVGFTKSEVDECVFTKGEVMYILYTDDSIIAAPKKSQVEEVMKDIEAAGLKITREGNVQDFLGINIEKKGKYLFIELNLFSVQTVAELVQFHANTDKKGLPPTCSLSG